MRNKLWILMALVMVAMVFLPACGGASGTAQSGGAVSTNSSVAPQSESNTASEEPKAQSGEKIKIGVSIWGYTDALGKDVYDFLTYAASALDVELVFDANGFDTEKTIASVENLIASGCKGIIVCNSSDGIMPKLINTCEQNGVYLAQFFRFIVDPEVKKIADSAQYFVGATHEDEVSTGYNLGKALADKGVKKVGLISWQHGDTTAEARYTGYKKAFEEFGIDMVAEQWEINVAEEASKAAENMLASFPEIEAIVVTGGSGEPLAGTLSAIENLGKVGKIQVVSTDFLPTLLEDLQEGKISAMSGGHFADPFFSMMMVYNVLNGTPGYSADKLPAEVVMDMIYVTSVEDVENYNKWFLGDQHPYNAEEIQQMSGAFNPDASIEQLKEIASKLSLQDVMERHK